MPPPVNMVEACAPMGASAVPTKIEGLTKLDPGKECGAKYRCDQKDGCTLEATSPAVTKNAGLAFVLDGQGGVAGPSAAGELPALQWVTIRLEKSGFFGTGPVPAKEKQDALTGRHWKRMYNILGVGSEPPYQLAVTLKMPYGSVLGSFGWMRIDGAPMPAP